MFLSRILAALTLVLCVTLGTSKSSSQSTPRPLAKGAQHLIYFEKNVGQARYEGGMQLTPIDAVVRVGGTLAYIHPKGLHIAQARVYPSEVHTKNEPDYHMDRYRVDMELIGSNASARIEFGEQLPGLVRYINEHTGVNGIEAPRYSSITYREVYPNIDLRMYLTAAGVKYDFVVHPGGNAEQIAMFYKGGSAPVVNDGGGLDITTPLGQLGEQAPIVFTKTARGDFGSAVPARFVASGQSVRFDIAAYDRTKTLVVDPQRLWATYLGGSLSLFANLGAVSPTSLRTAFDSTGNTFLAGSTYATDMPNVAGVLQRRLKGTMDCFIAKFSESGTFRWHT